MHCLNFKRKLECRFILRFDLLDNVDNGCVAMLWLLWLIILVDINVELRNLWWMEMNLDRNL
jgi:hypothetical protein